MRIGNGVHHRAVRVRAHRDVHGGDSFVQPEHALNVRGGLIQHVGDLLRAGLVIELLGEFAGRAQVDIQFLDHVDRQPNGAGLVHDAALDGLANPPGGVGGKAKTPLGVEFFHGADQAQVALFNQIQQGQAAIDVPAGNFHHQAQVTLNHTAPGTGISLQREAGEVLLFVGGEQRGVADFVQVQLGGVEGGLDAAGGAGPGLVKKLEFFVLLGRRLGFRHGIRKQAVRLIGIAGGHGALLWIALGAGYYYSRSFARF